MHPAPYHTTRYPSTISPSTTAPIVGVHGLRRPAGARQSTNMELYHDGTATRVPAAIVAHGAGILFQNVQIFYDDCCANLGSSQSHAQSHSHSHSHSGETSMSMLSSSVSSAAKRGRKRRQRSDVPLAESHSRFPLEFDATVNWPHLQLTHPKIPSGADCDKHPHRNAGANNSTSKSDTTSRHHINSDTLPAAQAFRCINSRGALAHGRPVTRHFLWTDVLARKEHNSVEDVFDSVGKGTRELRTVEQIKDEIMTAGLVVSVSFCLNLAYLQQIDNVTSGNNTYQVGWE